MPRFPVKKVRKQAKLLLLLLLLTGAAWLTFVHLSLARPGRAPRRRPGLPGGRAAGGGARPRARPGDVSRDARDPPWAASGTRVGAGLGLGPGVQGSTGSPSEIPPPPQPRVGAPRGAPSCLEWVLDRGGGSRNAHNPRPGLGNGDH